MKESLFQLVYFTFLHNAEVIAYVLMAVMALIMLIRKPARRYVFLFVGFLLVAFLFEYQKHIVGNLAEQTVNTLYQTGGGTYRTQRLTNLFMYHAVPLALWLGGWGMIALGILIDPEKRRRKQRQKTETEEKSEKSDSITSERQGNKN